MVMPSTHTTVNSSAHAISAPSRVDPEVLEKPERRQFSAAYKLQILQETDSCEAGQSRAAKAGKSAIAQADGATGVW